jgi:dTDP-4-amino-4,6-dideoxygalactose transaminase
MSSAIPLVNLDAQYAQLRDEVLAAMETVVREHQFINSKHVRRFEADMAARFGAAHAVGCSNGTSAIYLALEALGVGPGDEVITTPHTFIATAEAISQAGATPVFADIDPRSYQIDPAHIEAAITPRTRAILPVHLYGNASDMRAILPLAKKHGLKVVEDCAQSHLATLDGRHLGTWGDAATFSFYPGKNLGAYGDAGMVFAKAEAHAERVRKILDHGRLSKYEHDVVGSNYRMDDLQAAVLGVKLRHLEGWTRRRREIAARYDAALQPAGFRTIEAIPGAVCVYHLYVVEVSNRDEVIARLKEQGIATGIHYPVPLHLQGAYASLGHRRGNFPHTEAAASRVLSLPICGALSDADAGRVVRAVLDCARP